MKSSFQPHPWKLIEFNEINWLDWWKVDWALGLSEPEETKWEWTNLFVNGNGVDEERGKPSTATH